MESSALASLMSPPVAASGAATGEGTGPPTAAGAAFATVLSATQLTADGVSALPLTAGSLPTPGAAAVAETGNASPLPADAGRPGAAPADAAVTAPDGPAVTADLLDALAVAPGVIAVPDAAAHASARRAQGEAVDADDGPAPPDAPVLHPLVLAIRAVESRSARSGGGVQVQPTPAEADRAVAQQYALRAVADRLADERVRSLAPHDALPEADPTMWPLPLRGPDAAASVAARPDPGPAHAAASGLPAPLASAVSFAAAGGAVGEGVAGVATAAAGPPVRNDAGGASVSWVAVDDARLAALARGGDAPPAEPLEIETPLGGRAWERSLGERVVWLVGQQIQAAEIKLNPPHLGPVEVRLTVSGGEASLSFGTPHAPVREAIEQALPRLREQLAEQNLVLVNVDVGDRGVFGQAAGRHLPQEAAHSRPVAAPEALAVGPTPNRGHSRGLVDEYA